MKLSKLGLLFGALFLVLSHMEPTKPLWTDEFLHFAFAGFKTTTEAWRAFLGSMTLNHGQTGAYVLLDFWLLKFFGAKLFWLRFPSLICAVFLFFAALHLMEQWGLSIFWQIIGLLALASQSGLMMFTAEARPYMPLAAAVIGTLSYYETALQKRKQWPIFTLGIVSILMGTLFHPYFSFYWLAICAYSFFKAVHGRQTGFSIKNFINYCNPLFCFLGVGCYFIIGFSTWIGRTPHFDLNPFEYLGSLKGARQMFFGLHLEFLWRFKGPFLLVLVFLFICFKKWRSILSPPLLLLSVGLGLSLLLSYFSYRAHYWILQRQWVASIALVPLASVWALSLISNQLPNKWGQAWKISFALVIGAVFCINSVKAFRNFTKIYEKRPIYEMTEQEPKDIQQWLDLANSNCEKGGPVWPVFSRIYEH